MHDLFISVEAVTPGEFKTRGAGIRIEYGIHPTHFGPCLLGVTPRGVCWLSFLSNESHAAALSGLKQCWRGAAITEHPEVTARVVRQIFSGLAGSKPEPLSVLVMGTNFQIKVWKALLAVPAGTLATYETIGEFIGAESSARAIGNAVAHNRIAFLIPCHRVIRKSGLLGGYRWGEVRKRAMLGWEAARTAA